MPIYEYRCERGHTFEVMQRMTDDPLELCEEHGTPVQRVFHPVAVHFKGSGFYNTDYGKKKSGAAARASRRARPRTRRSPIRAQDPRTPDRARRRARSLELLEELELRLARYSPSSSFRTASRFEPSDTKRLLPLQQVASSTSVSPELPVAMSPNSIISWKPFMSVLSVRGAFQLTHGQPDEGARRLHLRPDRGQHLLLARGAVAVVLAGRAAVLPHTRVAERPAAVQVDLALPEVRPFQKLSNGGEQMRVLLSTVIPPSALIKSGNFLKSTSITWFISSPLPEERLDRLDRQRGAAERVGGVDLVDAVAGDVDLDVARDRELADAAEARRARA